MSVDMLVKIASPAGESGHQARTGEASVRDRSFTRSEVTVTNSWLPSSRGAHRLMDNVMLNLAELQDEPVGQTPAAGANSDLEFRGYVPPRAISHLTPISTPLYVYVA